MAKTILDLCGGTGSWSRPYLLNGFSVLNITLPDYDVTRWSLLDNEYLIFYGLKGAKDCVVDIKNVYGILAAPPCTQFSFARTYAKKAPDLMGSMVLVKNCLKIIWACQYNIKTGDKKTSLEFWALENPRGLLRSFLGKPAFTFAQWEYGEKLTKNTDIWGNFNEPKKIIDKKPVVDIDKEWQKPLAPEWLKDKKLNRQAIRAITPELFAKAFYDANNK